MKIHDTTAPTTYKINADSFIPVALLLLSTQKRFTLSQHDSNVNKESKWRLKPLALSRNPQAKLALWLKVHRVEPGKFSWGPGINHTTIIIRFVCTLQAELNIPMKGLQQPPFKCHTQFTAAAETGFLTDSCWIEFTSVSRAAPVW